VLVRAQLSDVALSLGNWPFQVYAVCCGVSMAVLCGLDQYEITHQQVSDLEHHLLGMFAADQKFRGVNLEHNSKNTLM
jgi:hypothetical protein